MIAPSPPASTMDETVDIRFPPWPAGIPQLGGLISFADFEPAGIVPPLDEDDSDSDGERAGAKSRKDGEEPELDGEGVPTVNLQVNHDPNRHLVKGRSRKATKQGILRVDDLFGVGGNEPIATRGGVPYNTALQPLTRVFRATKEWEVSRKFALGYTSNHIWMSWKKYAQVSKPQGQKTNVEPEEEEDAANSDEELEDEDGFIFHPEPEFFSAKEGAECRFLSSIVETVRIWLSYEFKASGLAWLDVQLAAAPLVTRSYLSYLLAHGVLPERVAELEEAVKVCKLAERDMLATKDVAVALEDGLNKLNSRLWGTAFTREQNQGWSSTPADHFTPTDDDTEEVNEVSATAADLGDLALGEEDAGEEDAPPVVVLADPSPDRASSPPPDEDEPSGSGWEVDPNEPSLSLALPDLLAADPPGTGTPTTVDHGGWGVSPSLLVDPKATLFPPSTGEMPSSAILSRPFESYKPAGEEYSLRRIVAVPPDSVKLVPEIAHHELARPGTGLGALVLEKWAPVPDFFAEVVAAAEPRSRGTPPPEAYVGQQKESIVVWVNEQAVKDKARVGMGIFGKFVWVAKKAEVGDGSDQDRGFWFADVVEDVIAEYWLAPKASTTEEAQ